jgi:hypothetical protein
MPPADGPEEPVTCDACGREFDSEAALEAHICNEGQVY